MAAEVSPSHGIKEVYCALPDRAIHKINQLMREADREMIHFRLVPDVKDYFKKSMNVKMLGHFPVVSTRTEALENMNNKVFKRAPRPHILQHTTEYSDLIDDFMVRKLVPNGINRWAKVSGLHGDTVTKVSMEARVAADICYLEYWSILLDLTIQLNHKESYIWR